MTSLGNWWDSPLIVVQTNLQIADTDKIDAEELMKQLKDRLKADVVVFNAAGIYAWYPTKIPFHNINPFMGNRDILKEVIESAHRFGIRFIARTSIGHAEDWIYHQHPEWFIHDEEGNPILIGEPRPGAWSLLYATCPNSPYQGEAVAYKIYEEIIDNYDIDGFFITFIGFPRPCYCGYCRKKYLGDMKKDIPKHLIQGSTEWVEYIEWQTKCIVENFRNIVNIIHMKRKDLLITGEFGGNSYTPYSLTQLCNLLSPNITDRIGNKQPPKWMPTVQTRYALNVSKNTPPWMIIAPAPGLIWRHSALPENEFKLWVSQVVANRGNIWHALTGIPDTQKDKRILNLIEEVDQKIELLKPFIKDAKVFASVAVLESRSNILNNSSQDKENEYLDELNGFYDALIAGHIPFNPIPEEHLREDILANYRLLILPDTRYLDEEQIRVIKSFINNGGSALSSYKTALFDKSGSSREDFALGKEFGIKFLGNEIKDIMASYMRIENRSHEIFRGIGDTEILPNGEIFLQVEPIDAYVPLTYIPPFAPLEGVGAPPERASFLTSKTNIPLLILKDRNPSRTAYFPSRIGRMIWKWKLPEHKMLLINTIRWLLGEDLTVHTDAPWGVYMSVLEGSKFFIINLVNAIGDRPLSEILPVYNVKIELKLQKEILEIEDLFSKEKLEFQKDDRGVSFIVPKVDYLTSIVIRTKEEDR